MTIETSADELFHDLAVMAMADGVLHPSETRVLDFYGEALGLDEEKRKAIIRDVISNKDQRLIYDGPDEERTQYAKLIEDVAKADGRIDPEEEELLERFRSRLEDPESSA